MNKPVSVTVALDARMHDGIARRATAMGHKVSAYLQMLIEAAYAARVDRERKVPGTDAELDDAVRAVFCLAGEFETAAIAKVTGFSEPLIDKILRGLKLVAAEPSPPAAADPPIPKTAKGYDTATVAKIAEMWATGASVVSIAKAIGRPVPGLHQWVTKHRDICPARRGGK